MIKKHWDDEIKMFSNDTLWSTVLQIKMFSNDTPWSTLLRVFDEDEDESRDVITPLRRRPCTWSEADFADDETFQRLSSSTSGNDEEVLRDDSVGPFDGWFTLWRAVFHWIGIKSVI